MIKNLETANFRVAATVTGYQVKPTSPLARAYLRLKKQQAPLTYSYGPGDGLEKLQEFLVSLARLEDGVAKLAAI